MENMITDEQLALLAKNDRMQMQKLLEKYKPLVLKCSKSFFLIGGETDDLIQEGMIGLFGAVQDFDSSREASFFTFAELCIQRQMIKAIEAANRQKNRPLNDYISLEGNGDESQEAATERMILTSGTQNPEDALLSQEEIRDHIDRVKKALSPLEKQVFDLFMQGQGYKEIAMSLGKSDKAIDNALTRIRQKAKGI